MTKRFWMNTALKVGVATAIGFGLAACANEKSVVEEAVEAEEAAIAENAEDDAGAEASEAPAVLAEGPTEEELVQMAADNAAAAEQYFAEHIKKEGVKATDSGIHYEVLAEGPKDGFSPKPSDIVDVHYVGTTLDGIEFDSSRTQGAAARFRLDQVIPGWTEGVQLMSEGDRFRFVIPTELAYGASGAGPIEPNSALIFDVELLKVTSPERNLDAANKFLAENKKKPGIKTTQSGLQYEVITEGASGGKSPSDANIVKVNYEGTLINGTKFDSSYDRGEPIEFPLANVIPGWTEGVQLMSEGDKFRFFIPPALGYGEGGTPGGPIGPNEALVFEVELLEVKS